VESAPIELLDRVFLYLLSVIFHRTSLRITYNVTVYSQRDSGIRIAHLLLHHRRCNPICQHLAGCSVSRCVEATARNAQPF